MRKDLRVVIVGGSHVGYHTAVRLNNRGHNVTVVEKDEDRVEFLNDQYVATVIHGQGGRPSVLRQTNLENSDVIAALTDYGAMTNIGICATAQRIAPDVRTSSASTTATTRSSARWSTLPSTRRSSPLTPPPTR